MNIVPEEPKSWSDAEVHHILAANRRDKATSGVSYDSELSPADGDFKISELLKMFRYWVFHYPGEVPKFMNSLGERKESVSAQVHNSENEEEDKNKQKESNIMCVKMSEKEALTTANIQVIRQCQLPTSPATIAEGGLASVGVQDPELPDSESNEKVHQNVTPAIRDQVQISLLSSEGAVDKGIKDLSLKKQNKRKMVLKYKYNKNQWSPLNPEGKKQYDREFLLNLEFQPMSLKKPSNLPKLNIIKDKATLHKLNEVNNRIASTAPFPQRGGYDPFEPAFARTNVQGRSMHLANMRRGTLQVHRNEPPGITLNNPINQQMKLHTAGKPAEVESISLGPGGKFSIWGKDSSGGAAKAYIEQSSRSAPLENRSAASSRESSRGCNNPLPPPAVRKTPSVSRECDNALEAVKSFTSTGVSEQRPPSEPRRPQEEQNVSGKDVTAAALKGADNLTEEEIEKKTKPLIDEFLHNCDVEEAVRCVVELASPSTVCFLIHTAVNQVLERSSQSRHMLGKLLHTLLKRKIITMEQYNKGLKNIFEFSDDYALDIPLICEYLGEIIEPMLDDDDLSLGFLIETLQPCIPSLAAGKLVSAVLLCASKKRGTLRVGEMWKESKLSWTDFLKPDTDMEEFVKTYKMEFTVVQIVEPKLRKQITPEEIKQNVQRLLQDHETNEEIFNWLERNVEGDMSPPMYRALVTVIYESVIVGSGVRCEINVNKLKDRMCILVRYMDVNRNLELHAIFALQHLMNKLDHPKGILLQIFDLAYNEDFLSDDAFKQWKKSNDPAEQEGKGVAIRSVSSFFTWLKEGDEDESSDGD